MALIKCACGCGGLREDVDKRGRPRKYILYHLKHSEETRKKIGNIVKGRKPSEETRKKMSVAKKGKIFSKEHRKNISDAAKGKIISEEQRKKISKSLKGRTASKEHRKNMSDAMKGKKHTKESRDKMSVIRKGIVFSEEHRKNISKSKSGENNPNWNNGSSFAPYCPKFKDKFKERVREYFNRECFNCGKPEADDGRKLSVHHIRYDKMTCCNDTEPLFVPLCKSCHSKTNNNREYWETKLTSKLMECNGGKCYYTIDEIKNKSVLI